MNESHLFPFDRLSPRLSDLSPGDSVTWLCVDRGGYGLKSRIAAKVIRVGTKRVTIEVHTPRGVVRRSVAPESLTEQVKSACQPK